MSTTQRARRDGHDSATSRDRREGVACTVRQAAFKATMGLPHNWPRCAEAAASDSGKQSDCTYCICRYAAVRLRPSPVLLFFISGPSPLFAGVKGAVCSCTREHGTRRCCNSSFKKWSRYCHWQPTSSVGLSQYSFINLRHLVVFMHVRSTTERLGTATTPPSMGHPWDNRSMGSY